MRTNRRLRWAAIPIAATLAIVLAGCTSTELHGFLPGFEDAGAPAVTNHTDRVAGLWTTSWIVLLVVGIITWGLILWAVVVYRRRKGQTGLPVQLRYHMPIEIFYTVVPLILVLGFFSFTARDQAAIEARFDDPDVKIQVMAKQWAWDFNYVNENVYSSSIQVQPKTGGEPGSRVEEDLPTLVLPVGKKIEFALDSRDVVHSFWIIDFLYKKDVIPGKTNYMSVIPERIGTYAGKCTEFCGEYHSLMLFNVKVVSPEDYAAYIDTLRAQGNVGQLDKNYDRNQNLPGIQRPASEEGK
ncbi:aa3-type cytochrome oxidase subunit II [Cryobacterium tepidiphilum]|uniref:cytochrome-c oxidase n=1 Tax=Cryobacterium tepidiphilum TaxID=2486026 RepID=A0A3M8LA02_9MICO|nr:cytochrome c oxidase subunit II [Cryobacterium tepidiphilum]RNE62337.1 cytochrome c oxidase subunit II [Cryobacterium tepidiphilum]